MYDIIYIDGDSYSTPDFCCPIADSYWYKFKNHINAIEYVNYAQPGKSNFSMIRNALRFYLQNKDKRIFFLIGFSHLYRSDFQDDKNQNPLNKFNFEERFIHQHIYVDKPDIVRATYEHEVLNFMTNCLLLYNFLESKNINFILHNCSNPYIEDIYSPLLKDFWLEILNLDKIPNLLNNTYLSINELKKIKPIDFEKHGWVGHHGPEGNLEYFNFLKQHYDSR